MGGSESNCPPCNCPEQNCPPCNCPEQNCPPCNCNCPECPVCEPVKEAIIYKDDIVKNDYNNLIKNISKLIVASFDTINKEYGNINLTQSPETLSEKGKEELRKSGQFSTNNFNMAISVNRLIIIGDDIENKGAYIMTYDTQYDDNDKIHSTRLTISTKQRSKGTFDEYELMKYPITKINYPSKDDLTENEKFITNKYESNSKFNFYPLIIIIIFMLVIFLFISKINRNNIDNYNCINPSNYKFNNVYF